MRQQILFLTLISISIVLLLGCVSAAPLSSGNSTIYVSPTGNDANTGLTPSTAVQTISTGITLVNDGGMIKLASGIYNKTSANGNDVNIDITKNVVIEGAGQDNTIIDAQNNSQIWHIGDGSKVLIKDITFIDGKLQNSGGAIANDGILTVTNCTFADNTADNEVGGALFTHTNLTVTDCLFYNNKANSGSAIFNKGGFITVTNNIFMGNIAADDLLQYNGGTINNYAGSYQIISNCFLGNTGSALHVDNYMPEGGIPLGLPIFTFNYMAENTYGIYLEPFEEVNELTSGIMYRVNATNNWWGSNSNPLNNPTNIAGDVNTVLADPWLVFTLSADPQTIPYGNIAQIIVDMSHNNLGQDISNIGHITDGLPVYMTSDIGDVGDAEGAMVNGVFNTILIADDGVGTANISAFLFGFSTPVFTQVMITADNPVKPVIPVTPKGVTHVSKPKNDPLTIGSIGMKDTGVPLAGLLLAFLMVLGGFTAQKSKLRF